MTPYVSLNKIIRYSFLFVFFSILCLVIWGIDKGFDLTDEGYYILGYQKGQEIGSDIRNFHIIIKTILPWLSLDIINVRILRLILVLSSSAALAFALKKHIKSNTDFIVLYSVIAIGNLLSYGFGPQSLSYNTLTANFIIFSLSFMILGIAEPNKQITRKHIIYNMLTGTFLALTFFVKPPAGILAAICFMFYFLINYHAPVKIKAISLLLTISGSLAGFMFYFLMCQSFYDFYHAILLNIDNFNKAGSGHDTSSFIKSLNILLYKIFEISSILSLFLLLFFFIKQKIKKKGLLYLLYTLLTICFLFFYNNYLITGPLRNAFPYLILTLAFILYLFIDSVIKKEDSGFNLNSISIIILLFIIPFAGSFGTNNALISNSMYMISCWTALIIYIKYEFKVNLYFKVFFIYLFLFTSAYLFYYHFVKLPYRISSLKTQNSNVSTERIKMDQETVKCFNNIYEILKNNNFKTGDPIIGLYKMPGLIYLMKGTSPGSALYPWDHRFNNLFIENLKNSKTNYKESYFLIKNPFKESLIYKLKALGVNFPDDYFYVGGVQIPGNNAVKGFCKIYVHKNKVNSKFRLANEISQQAYYALMTYKYNKSITLYLKALSLRPENSTDLNNIGLAYMRNNNLPNAIIYFKKALYINPKFALARSNLSWAISELKKSEQL